MTVDDIFQQLDALLDEEQAAIVRIDGPAVEGIAHRKLALVEALRAADPGPEAEALRHLGRRLRHNGVLLAHARHCLQDVVQTLAAPGPAATSGSYNPRGGTAATSSHISVTG